MYVCVRVCVAIHQDIVGVRVGKVMCMRKYALRKYVCMNMHDVNIHMYMYARTHSHMCLVCTYEDVCKFTYMCVNICMCVCVCMCVAIH